MAIAVDASSPPTVGASATSLQTGTFSPPAGSVLVVCVNGDRGRASWTITNTVASLSWTQAVHAFPAGGDSASAYYAVLPGGATNMSVSAAGSLANYMTVKVLVVTGADTASPIGAVASGGTTADTSNVSAHSIVPQVSNSLGIITAADAADSGTTTSPNTTFEAFDVASGISSGVGYRVMGAAGGTETFTVDAAGSAAASWAWGVFEVRAASTPVSAAAPSVITHGVARMRAAQW
jgi:hypothetical protein